MMVQMFRRWTLVVVLLAAPAGLLAFLRAFPRFDPAWYSPNAHLIVVSAIAACALFVASVAIVSATRTPQAGVVWMALACSFVGLFMLAHGISTPGAMAHHETNSWAGRLPYAAITGFAVCLLIAGRRQDRGINRWVGNHPFMSVILPLVPATLFVAALVDDPLRFHGGSKIAHENTWLAALSTTLIAVLLVSIWRHGRRWHLGKDPVQLALVARIRRCRSGLCCRWSTASSHTSRGGTTTPISSPALLPPRTPS